MIASDLIFLIFVHVKPNCSRCYCTIVDGCSCYFLLVNKSCHQFRPVKVTTVSTLYKGVKLLSLSFNLPRVLLTRTAARTLACGYISRRRHQRTAIIFTRIKRNKLKFYSFMWLERVIEYHKPFETREYCKEEFLSMRANYQYLENFFVRQYFKANCDIRAVIMATLKVHKKKPQISVFANYLKN